jgi:L-amino acid N-acyltransferase YncA
MSLTIRPMIPQDWPAVAEIYGQGITSEDATFERDVPTWDEWDAHRLQACRIVAEADGDVVGFACVSPISTRCVYRGVCEVMVYVSDGARGNGVGGLLMSTLVQETEAAGVWMLQASIFPENEASIRAHLRVGFRIVGTRDRIGKFYDGRWRDTVLMDRRSLVCGLE